MLCISYRQSEMLDVIYIQIPIGNTLPAPFLTRRQNYNKKMIYTNPFQLTSNN